MAKCLFCDDCTINLSNASGSSTEIQSGGISISGGFSIAGLSVSGDILNVTLSGQTVNLFVEKVQVKDNLPNCRLPPCPAYPCQFNPYGYQPHAAHPCKFNPYNYDPWGNTS